ncbi:hypothetical protein [Paenibacillus koleovorans]|uniref:hypothetical protein n=1 Tax=Paenibacillus koleovorans TaxID=121608 RepID=UPI000FDC9274|nr:hypothetical protein [Paenibacillus koleovorans]
MGQERTPLEKKPHLFQVEIMLEHSSHALALATLMQVLNHDKVKDFRITGGIELGKQIEAALAAANVVGVPPQTVHPPVVSPGSTSPLPPAVAPAAAPAVSSTPRPAAATSPKAKISKEKISLADLEEYKDKGTLIRLTVVKGKGVRLSLPCRILNFDAAADNLTIYHVDEKKVYSFKLNEIEDMEAPT